MAVPLKSIDTCPELALDACRAGGLVAFEYTLAQFWLKQPGQERLIAVYDLQVDSSVRFLVQPASEGLRDILRHFSGDLAALAEELGCETFADSRAVFLKPVHIPKPWGEEIWYTGMEDRGVAEAGRSGEYLPLPWVLSALPRRLCKQRERSIVLLKILAPRPEEVFGDLYFELHEKKREVYVVTSVDKRAWPDGRGAIRFGFSPEKRAEVGDDDSFRESFRRAVRDYEAVRREIDRLLDERGEREDCEPDREAWLKDLPETLLLNERQLREEMNSFTALMPLEVGDVVKVPTFTPHSLQHGVRTVEFQTPVYERLIVAFAQKVLTQEHWDTLRATELMSIDTPPPEPSFCLREEGGLREERIVDFSDFEVRRYSLESGAKSNIAASSEYAVLMVVQGSLVLDGETLEPEEAVFLPAGWTGAEVKNADGQALIFLIAYPR